MLQVLAEDHTGKVKNYKGVCVNAQYRLNKKGIRLTLRDNTDEIAWDSWDALPEVRPGLCYVIEHPGAVEKHKTIPFKDSNEFFIKGETSTRITQVRKDNDMPEFLTRPMKLECWTRSSIRTQSSFRFMQ